MNYRHGYHAGNFADVLKHVVLVAILDRLCRKPAPLYFLDTHAGRGHYPLDGDEAQRAGEFRDGILRILDAPAPPAAVARYLELVRTLGSSEGRLTAYPGSPRIAAACLRRGDRAAFCELEPREGERLRAELRHDGRLAVHDRDGYEALVALVPPAEKRGLVLIDPPYEQPDESERLLAALVAAHARWPTGVYAAWYPIKHGEAHARLLARMQATGIRRQLTVELVVRPEDSPIGLNGSGLLIVNPPWQLDEDLRQVLPWLHAQLARDGHGAARVAWRVPE